MSKHHLSARIDSQKHIVDIGLDVISWVADGIYYHYAPALDLTGYGVSESESKNSFQHQLNEFVNYTLNKGTIYDELERLGWTTNKKKKRIVAPNETELLEDNETYRDLISNNNTHKY